MYMRNKYMYMYCTLTHLPYGVIRTLSLTYWPVNVNLTILARPR